MRFSIFVLALVLFGLARGAAAQAADLGTEIERDYQQHLGALFQHFHRHPELSFKEHRTAARMAEELRASGFDVTEGVGGTGLVAIMQNGTGPMVMMRADMDGLPVQEKSGLEYASEAKQTDRNGNEVFVMHACGHDVHITSLVGTARQMAARRDQWAGTLMLIVQPAEEIIAGAEAMMNDDLWDRFGKPDMALAFHVDAAMPTGRISAPPAPYSGSDTVDIIVHGLGGHGASPHRSIDPVVLASQIVLGLQTVVSRNLPPREPGVITVGAFHAGTKHNIISDEARLQLTVRSESEASRDLLLSGIERVATNMGRAAGLPEELLPEVIVSDESVPPTLNDPALTARLRAVWGERFGDDVFWEEKRLGMGAEDFPFFTTDPAIPSTYFAIGGTPPEDFEAEKSGGAPVPSHHSPLFRIDPEPAVTLGTEATVSALLELMPAP
jgi:amidohydrolase